MRPAPPGAAPRPDRRRQVEAAGRRRAAPTVRPQEVRARERRPAAPVPTPRTCSRRARRARQAAAAAARAGTLRAARLRSARLAGRRPGRSATPRRPRSRRRGCSGGAGSDLPVRSPPRRVAVGRRRRVVRARRRASGSGSAPRRRRSSSVVQLLLVEPGASNGLPPATVRQREPRRRPDVLGVTSVAPRPGGERDRGPGHHQVGAHPVDLELGADARRSAAAPPRGSRTDGSIAWAARDPRRPVVLARRPSRGEASGSASKASRRRTTSARSAGSRVAATSTVSPNRSSSCGRSSPSSGFIVPTSRNRAACQTETPSRST